MSAVEIASEQQKANKAMEAYYKMLQKFIADKLQAFDNDAVVRQKKIQKFGSRFGYLESLENSCRTKLQEQGAKYQRTLSPGVTVKIPVCNQWMFGENDDILLLSSLE